MNNGNPNKPRLLWIAVKLFDKSVDKATWIETANILADDYDVHLLTGWRDRAEPIPVAGRTVRYFPQMGSGIMRKITRHLLMCYAVERKIATIKPEIVLINCNNGLSVLRTVARATHKLGCKAVLDLRTLPTTDAASPEFQSLGGSLAFAARNFTGITYITDEMRRYCLKRYHLPEHRSAVWTSGVNSETFTPGIPLPLGGPFRLIYHGGIISVNRGLDRLIQAIDRVRDLDVHLTLISSLREPEAIAWIERLNLRNQVTLVDTIPHAEVPLAIQNHHAGILPFPNYDIWNTSSPIKLFEYMACGKPVVVTDIPAHRSVLEGKPYAFFARDATAEALAEAIRMVCMNRESLNELGVLARQQVVAYHTWNRQAGNLGVFLKKMIR